MGGSIDVPVEERGDIYIYIDAADTTTSQVQLDPAPSTPVRRVAAAGSTE